MTSIRLLRTTLRALCLVASIALGARAFAQDPPATPPAAQAPATPMDDASWQALIVRDARIGFTSRSVDRALADLARTRSTPEIRASALYALGAAGAKAERSRLESWALEGSVAERQGATLALGELGSADSAMLVRLARGAPPEIGGCALLALVRTRSQSSLTAVQKIIDEPANPLSEMAKQLMIFAVDPSGSHPCAPASVLLELRWRAAQCYGLVDGQTWSLRLLDTLLENQNFLDEVIYGVTSTLHRPGIADHFLEVAMTPGSPVRLRGAVNAIPAELDRVVASGLWVPSGDAEWAQILFEIDERRLEGLTENLLRTARLFPDWSAYASLLLVRGGNQEGLPLLELDLASKSPLERARIAETLGGTGEERFVELLDPLLRDPEPSVRASALIAQHRLGDQGAREALRQQLGSHTNPDRGALVEELCRLARVPEIQALLVEYAGEFDGEQRLAISTALSLAGRSEERDSLRAAMRDHDPTGDAGASLIRALGQNPSMDDLTLLRELFPRENEFRINVELARALIAQRDPSIAAIARAALWQEPFNRSVLAGALLIEVGGIDALRLELQTPPHRATQRELRRVGFALGEWGGIDEVERLARRATAADPALQGALLGALGARTH